MQTYLECIPCFVRQAYDALRQVTDDEALMHRALQRVLVEAAAFKMDLSPPEMAQTIHRIIREESGSLDPYASIKAHSNAVALRLLEEAQPLVDGAADPFAMAVRFSIAGNIMDFALTSKMDDLDLVSLEKKALHKTLDDVAVETLRQAVLKAESILVLGDNAGEIVFDRLLVEQMGHAEVAYAVKGSPVINDATREDARVAGMDQLAEIIDTGNDAPGILLNQCAAPFLEWFNRADLVIAKGQANYETLSRASRPLFFLTQVKCPVIGRDLNQSVGSWVVQYHSGEPHV
jgi:uncharacterized protein with ATP-grasp and redox domains